MSEATAADEDEVAFTTLDGNRYVGQKWIDGVAVVGTLYLTSGARYQGELLNGVPQGFGIMTAVGADGGTIVYDGDWINNSRSGTGRLRRFRQGVSSPLTYLYEGTFLSDQTHGSGTETIWTNPLLLNSNAAKQQHQQQQQSASLSSAGCGGSGVLFSPVSPDTSGGAFASSYAVSAGAAMSAPRIEYRYTGSFAGGMRHGHGLLEDHIKQRIIEGSFAENQPHGTGIVIKYLRPESGLKSYDGSMQHGEMHGTGTLVSSVTGEMFRGEFKHNRKLRGIVCDADGVSNARRAVYDENSGVLVSFEDIDTGSIGRTLSMSSSFAALASPPTTATAATTAAAAAAAAKTGESGNNRGREGEEVDVETQYELGEAAEARIDYKNGDVFRGDVISGRPHGSGCTIFALGGGYKGGYSDGLFHGSGLLMQQRLPALLAPASASPRQKAWRYVGSWSNGEFHGHGRWWSALQYEYLENADENGMKKPEQEYSSEVIAAAVDEESEKQRRDFFEGCFVHGRFATGRIFYGSGTHADGAIVYEGEFGADSLPHGRGVMRMRDRTIRGIFFNDSCCDEHATIEHFLASSDNHDDATNNNNEQQQYPVETYEGGVLNNKKHGTGVHKKYRNGEVVEVYDGEHALDRRNGVGILDVYQVVDAHGAVAPVLSGAGFTVEGLFRHGVQASHCTVRKHADNSRFVGSFDAPAGIVAGVVSSASGMEIGTVM